MEKRQLAWDVYRIKRDGSLQHIETVFFDPDMDHEDVKRSLVDHDGFSPDIVVLAQLV